MVGCIRRGVLLAGVAAFMSLALPQARAQVQAKRPNIIWIVCEDITTFIGAYGDRLAATPNIDRLAAEGTRYTHAYQAAGVCAPARAAVITGMYPTSVGAHNMRTGASELSRPADGPPTEKPPGIPVYSVVLPPEVKAFPEYLRKAGYYTSNNQKTDYQFEAPVTVWDESSPAASYRNRPPDAPFFSVFNFFLTHESMIAFRKDPLIVDPAGVTVPPIYPDTPEVRSGIARMYTNIALMDRQVGELVAMLKADGLYDDTVIFFFSDNGGNLPWFKREVLERGAHVPLIVKPAGGGDGGRVETALVSGVDFAPTVLSLAGLPIPAHLQGQALLGPQKAAVARRHVFAARDRMDAEIDRVRSVRDARFRYVHNYRPDLPRYQNIAFRLSLPIMTDILRMRDAGRLNADQMSWFGNKPVEELYDVEQDPWELTNLAGNPLHADKLGELRQAFQDWTQRHGDLGAVPEAELLRRMWNGGSEPPRTEPPTVMQVDGGVRLSPTTVGASIGYRVRQAGDEAARRPHVVQSWDYERLAGELQPGPFARPGDVRPAPPSWNVYDGEIIALARGATLEIRCLRIGYKESVSEYVGR